MIRIALWRLAAAAAGAAAWLLYPAAAASGRWARCARAAQHDADIQMLRAIAQRKQQLRGTVR